VRVVRVVGMPFPTCPSQRAAARAAVLAHVGAGVVLAHRLAADPRLVLERQAGAEVDRERCSRPLRRHDAVLAVEQVEVPSSRFDTIGSAERVGAAR
jgi:hypothetical protein